MIDHGTCQLRLQDCNRPATHHVVMQHATEGREITYLVCEEHSEVLARCDGVGSWCIVTHHALETN